MPETIAAAPGRTSRRILYFLIVVLVAFLAGFVPMWMKARDQSAERAKAERALVTARIVKDLGSATIDARRGEYEAARQEASAFFDEAVSEIDRGSESALAEAQRNGLAPLLAPRDQVITLLARSDPASADLLSTMYVAVRKALGA
ncbi:MAG: hypothetical protein ABSB86_20640 [Bryobacteraceae bacterium]|jgi:hypothetical protein